MMKEYTILKINGTPDWGNIPAADVAVVLWKPDCGVRMAQQLCYDEEAIYVRQQAWESAVRAEYTAPLSPVHKDSCMEFFFLLGEDDRYFNFEINPNGCIELGFGENQKKRIRVCYEDEQASFQVRCSRTADGWTAEYYLPLEFLQVFYPDLRLEPSVRIRGNFYKCGDLTEKPHYLAWNPVNTPTPNFHCPCFFGRMIFA